MASPAANVHCNAQNGKWSGRVGNAARKTGQAVTLLFLFLFSLNFAMGTALADSAKVLGARLGVYPDYTRFVIDLDRNVDFTYFLLPDPYRIIIDMPEIDWSAPPGNVTSGGGLISGLRYGLSLIHI